MSTKTNKNGAEFSEVVVDDEKMIRYPSLLREVAELIRTRFEIDQLEESRFKADKGRSTKQHTVGADTFFSPRFLAMDDNGHWHIYPKCPVKREFEWYPSRAELITRECLIWCSTSYLNIKITGCDGMHWEDTLIRLPDSEPKTWWQTRRFNELKMGVPL